MISRPYVYRTAPGRWIVSAPSESSAEWETITERVTQLEAFDAAYQHAISDSGRYYWSPVMVETR